ncbi:hypothetical protein ZWY2020_054652 [Hordeum vulgare]|nr:hypothetical protein ZWY2020_054652 [Hordeum vulgare]
MAMAAASAGGEPVEPQSLKKLSLKSLKRSLDLFAPTHSLPFAPDAESKQIRVSCKVNAEYGAVKNLPSDQGRAQGKGAAAPSNALALLGTQDTKDAPRKALVMPLSLHHLCFLKVPESAVPGKNTTALSIPGSSDRFSTSALMERLPSRWPKPVWHAPWKNYRNLYVLLHIWSSVVTWDGVRSIAFDPGNEWFCTGSADRTIKIWDLASGALKLTLTGHIEQVRTCCQSAHTYLFSAGDDKQVKCWDLEQNKVWDIRTKAHVSALTGHDNTVCSDPQVVTGSHDTTIKFWDLVAGKTMCTLTHHKKSVRAMALHPKEKSFASASADNIKKWSLPKGEFLHNMLSQQKTILNAMAVNEDGVLATAGDNGSMWFWDWKSGHNFQQNRLLSSLDHWRVKHVYMPFLTIIVDQGL